MKSMKRFRAGTFHSYDYVYDVRRRRLYDTWISEGWDPSINSCGYSLAEFQEILHEVPLLRISIIKGIFDWEAALDKAD